MANTLGNIRDAVYYRLAQPISSSTYDYNNRVRPKINYVLKQICKGIYKDILKSGAGNDVVYRASDLRFLKKKFFLEKKDGSVNTQTISPGDTTIFVNTINFANSGHGIISNNIFSYTNKNPNQLLGVSGIIVKANPGTLIEQVFLLPSDYDRIISIYNILANNSLVEVPYQNGLYDRTKMNCYFILEDDSFTQNFVYIKGNYGVNNGFYVYYYMKHPTLVNDNDLSLFPGDEDIQRVADIIAGELKYETEEITDAQALLNKGYSGLHTFYNEQGTKNNFTNNKIEYKKVGSEYYTSKR